MKQYGDNSRAVFIVAQGGRFHLIAGQPCHQATKGTLPLGSVSCEATALRIWRALYRHGNHEPWQK